MRTAVETAAGTDPSCDSLARQRQLGWISWSGKPGQAGKRDRTRTKPSKMTQRQARSPMLWWWCGTASLVWFKTWPSSTTGYIRVIFIMQMMLQHRLGLGFNHCSYHRDKEQQNDSIKHDFKNTLV